MNLSVLNHSYVNNIYNKPNRLKIRQDFSKLRVFLSVQTTHLPTATTAAHQRVPRNKMAAM